MSVSEPGRHHLYEAARSGRWDDDAAETLMSLLPPVGWSDLAHQTRTMLLSLVGLLIAGAGVAIGTAQLVG